MRPSLAFDSFPAPRSAVIATVVKPALFVVEFFFEGSWRPLCGDAYLDEAEAVRCSERSELETRVTRYTPEAP